MARALAGLLLWVMPWGMCRSQDLARVYVYAHRETRGKSWIILCDGTPAAKLTPGTVFAISVTAGPHLLSRKKGVALPIEMHAGDETFVRLGWHVDLGEPPTLVFDKVPAAVARKEMRFVVYIGPRDALSGRVSKTDPRPVPEMHFKVREESTPR